MFQKIILRLSYSLALKLKYLKKLTHIILFFHVISRSNEDFNFINKFLIYEFNIDYIGKSKLGGN